MILKKSPVLSIETSTPVCSVGLRMPDGTIAEERAEGQGVHSELTFVFIRKLMERNELRVGDFGAVLVSAGPGSYTGLRVAGSAVKGLLFQTGVPLYAYSTLGSIALGVRRYQSQEDRNSGNHHRVDTVINARRVHLYHQSWGLSEAGVSPESDVKVRKLDEILDIWQSGQLIAGTGIDRLVHLGRTRNLDTGSLPSISDPAVISAVNIFELQDFNTGKQTTGQNTLLQKVNPELFEPNYFSGL